METKSGKPSDDQSKELESLKLSGVTQPPTVSPSSQVFPTQIDEVEFLSSILEKEANNTEIDIVGGLIFLIVGIPPLLVGAVSIGCGLYMFLSGGIKYMNVPFLDLVTGFFIFGGIFFVLGNYATRLGLTKLTGRNLNMKVPKPVIVTAIGGMVVINFLYGNGRRTHVANPHPLISVQTMGMLMSALFIAIVVVWIWCLRKNE